MSTNLHKTIALIAIVALAGMLIAATDLSSTQAFAHHSQSAHSAIVQKSSQKSTVISGKETENLGNNAALNFNEGNSLAFNIK